MAKLKKTLEMTDQRQPSEFDWRTMRKFFSQLCDYYRLYFVILVILGAVGLLAYAAIKPVYTAVAIIGPPNPSPMSSLLSGLTGGDGSTSGIARRLLGGQTGAGAANDPFQEYLQLLQSNRLATALVEKDNLLPKIFPDEWDATNNRWRPPGVLHNLLGAAKRLLHRPVKDHADSDDLKTYLENHFGVSEVTTRRSSVFSAGSAYMIVAFSFTSPQEAEAILNTILHRADEIIREEQARDVLARISFLQAELPSVTQTEQREALITTLSGQEEMKMMIKADQRYASTLVDTPHASPTPTSPMSPGRMLIGILFLSAFVWGTLVGLETRSKIVRSAISRFRSQREKNIPIATADAMRYEEQRTGLADNT